MPRSTQSALSRVLEYVRTTPLEVLEETFPLVQDIIRERRAKSSAAKARATKATKTPAAATVTSPCTISWRFPQRCSLRDYFAAGGRSLWSIRDRSALRNEFSVSIVLVNPA